MNEDIFSDYKKEIHESYKNLVRSQFSEMVAELGVDLKGVYNSWSWARPFTGYIRSNVTDVLNIGRTSKSSRDPVEYQIDEEKLEINAMQNADLAIGKMKMKINEKVGQFDSFDEPYLSDSYIFIHGYIKGHDVVIRQNIIVNVSSKGMLFNQFPMRLELDGKPISAAKYKNQVELWFNEDMTPTQGMSL